MNKFNLLESDGKGQNQFMYGGVQLHMSKDGDDLHIRLSFGATELNFMCEDANDFLSVCSEALVQDIYWDCDTVDNGEEPF